MTTLDTRRDASQLATSNGHALPLDRGDLTAGQREALEVAESAREDTAKVRSFAGDLFLGHFDPSVLHPFPVQSEDDKRIGDELVAKVSAVLTEHLDPDEVDETRTIPAEVIRRLRDLGVFRMKIPQEYGGLGLSQVNYNRVVMAIASYCGSTAVLVSAHQSIGVPQPLKMFGTEEQKQKYFALMNDGALSAFALTEPEVGSDPARMSTTATKTKDGRHYILNGVKQWTTNGPIADLLVVMARTAPKIRRGREIPQITAFIVETDRRGVKCEHRCDFMGLRGIQNGIIRFENVKVPAENILWGEGLGLKLALKTLNTGRLTLPAACAGLGKQCLSISRQWGRERVQWGRAIGEHEHGREKLAFIAATTFAMEAVTWLTSNWKDRDRDIRVEAAMAKLFCSEASWQIIDQTVQFRGGRGYERANSLKERGETPYPVERIMRDSRINTIIEGTTEIMQLFIAREALDPHLRKLMTLLGDERPMKETLRLGAGLGAHYVAWYTGQLARTYFGARYKQYGELAHHYRYIDRTCHRLARTLFHLLGRYQEKLEREQILLARIVDICTELFVMSATCAYATSTSLHHNGDGSAVTLAKLFCEQAKKRIGEHFRSMHRRPQSLVKSVSNDVLSDKYRWLEDGIIPCVSEERETEERHDGKD